MLSTRIRAFYTPLIGFLPSLGLAAILFFGGRQVINGTLSLGDFTAFYAYLLMLISPMRSLGIFLGMAQRAVASGARVFQILDREPEMKVPEGAPALPPGAGRIELRDVTMTYPGAADARAARRLAGGRGGNHNRARRRHGVGQDDARLAHPPPLRRGLGGRAGGRRRRVEGRAHLTARRHRAGHGRPVPVLGQRAREHRLRPARGHARGGRGGGPARPGGRVHRRAAGRLRHADRRARPDAVGRPAPAAGDRPRAARRPAHPHPRRRDLVGRRLHRARDQVRRCRR